MTTLPDGELGERLPRVRRWKERVVQLDHTVMKRILAAIAFVLLGRLACADDFTFDGVTYSLGRQGDREDSSARVYFTGDETPLTWKTLITVTHHPGAKKIADVTGPFFKACRSMVAMPPQAHVKESGDESDVVLELFVGVPGKTQYLRFLLGRFIETDSGVYSISYSRKFPFAGRGDQNVDVDVAIKNRERWIRELHDIPFESINQAVADKIAAATGAAEPPTATEEADREPRLPDGTIRRGSLANAQLIRDAHDGVFPIAVIMGMSEPKKEEMYVVQDPVGLPGRQCWREAWFLTDGNDVMVQFDMLFMEDGQGGATWVVENSAKVPGGVIKRTGDGERAAAMRALPQNLLDAVVRAESERYIAAANAFVAQASEGHVVGMMALTSPLTLAIQGLNETHDQYAEDYVPRFRNATVEWDKDFVLISDETGNRGIELSGTLKGAKEYRIDIAVMREGGKHVVIGLTARLPGEPKPLPQETSTSDS